MGWLSRWFGILDSDSWLDAKMTSWELDTLLRAGVTSSSGVRVNWETALQTATVLACARVIAEGISQVPWKLFSGATTEARDHPLYDMVYRRPNPFQTSFEFRETLAFHLVLTGNAYVRKMRVGRDRRLVALEVLEPQKIEVKRESDGRLRYFFTPEGGSKGELDAGEIWHMRGPSWNSWFGLEPVRLAREAIGLAIATEAAHGDMHGKGVRSAGAYSVDGTLTADQYKQLLKLFAEFSQGGSRAGTPMILDRGAKFMQTQMSGVDAQHIETRKFQVEEICRAMRVMPIMVGLTDKTATYASAEQMFLAHVTHTLMPWYERIEQSADINLLGEDDRRRGFYLKFKPNALMRGAAADRAEFYAKALGAGGTPAWMTQDEVRELEEMEPMGGAAAQLNPGSMGGRQAAGA